jgi:hypothetical protein
MTKTSENRPSRRMLYLVAGTIAMTAACGAGSSGGGGGAAAPGGAGSTAAAKTSSTSGAQTKLEVDACTLLTVPEMEAAIGTGVERGGFSTDAPGSCTFSIGGDVGAGTVHITNEDPLTCRALQSALDAGALDATNAVKIDVGDGGIYERKAGHLQFAIAGGCLSISASHRSDPIGQDALVTLAHAAAGRIT